MVLKFERHESKEKEEGSSHQKLPILLIQINSEGAMCTLCSHYLLIDTFSVICHLHNCDAC